MPVMALVPNDAWSILGGELYRAKIEELALLLQEKGWPFLMATEARIREHILPKTVRELTNRHNNGLDMPIVGHMHGVGQQLKFNPDRPWESAFEALATNTELWRQEVEVPCFSTG